MEETPGRGCGAARRLPGRHVKEGHVRKYAGNPWIVLLVVSLGFFMTLLDKSFLGAKTFDQRYRSS